MTKKTKQIRIKKDYFRNGYYSVHLCEYKSGKLAYESTLGYYKKKRDAETFKRLYKKGRAKGMYEVK